MASRMLLLKPLKGAELSTIAFRCGFNRSGTKETIRQHIMAGMKGWEPLPPNARILSVDLGIRNLAYSLLSTGLVQSPGLEEPKKIGWDKASTVGQTQQLPAAKQRPKPPHLLEWQRLSLLSPTANPSDIANSQESPAIVVQDFGPGTLSTIAVQLVRDKLLPLNPSHILIERQRSRSGSGASVLEWTMRVNSLESMLYAILSYLQATGVWKGQVIAVEPKRVATFLLNEATGDELDLTEEEERTTMTSLKPRAKVKIKKLERVRGNDIKKEKIALLAKLLEDHEGIKPASDDVENKARMYLERSKGKQKLEPRPRSGRADAQLLQSQTKATSPFKSDDLADCLLQAIAWLKWEANRKILMAKGTGPLLKAPS